jgi:hypothetical protein
VRASERTRRLRIHGREYGLWYLHPTQYLSQYRHGRQPVPAGPRWPRHGGLGPNATTPE